MKDLNTESRKRLEHILSAIGHIEKYVCNETVESFVSNELLYEAVLYNFSVIGEAITHIENEKLSKYDYPWYTVRSFRNMIAHEYFNIELKAVWQTIKKNLPELKDVINSILSNEF